MTADELATALEQTKLPSTTEEHLQVAIAARLTELGVTFEREHRLSAKDRPDFFVDGLAIEVKIKGTLTEVTRQLARYAAHVAVREVLLVTSRLQLASVPRTLNGKPVHVSVQLGGL